MQNPVTKAHVKYFDLLIMGFIFLVLFGMPVIFTRTGSSISWQHVYKIWLDHSLLLPVFFINHWLLVPRLLFRKQALVYMLVVVLLVLCVAFGYRYFEQKVFVKKTTQTEKTEKRPEPVPPYAELLMFSILIVGVDTGLRMTRRWNEIEEKKQMLELKNTEMQLSVLKSQVSPHFFMNTLNNIYALVDCDTPGAKVAVMKLSKLMRYMLYENDREAVKLSKEFEFLNSYIDLMKLRYADGLTVHVVIDESLLNELIPPMLFICYIENAFKHGISYRHENSIQISFVKKENKLHFSCVNSKATDSEKRPKGGLGLINNQNRLNLLFGNDFKLDVTDAENSYKIELEIPLI